MFRCLLNTIHHTIDNLHVSNQTNTVTVYRLRELIKSFSIVFPIYFEFHANSPNPTTNANNCLVHKVPYQLNMFQPICHSPVRNGKNLTRPFKLNALDMKLSTPMQTLRAPGVTLNTDHANITCARDETTRALMNEII